MRLTNILSIGWILLLAGSPVAALAAASDDGNVVFQIGVFDGSSAEFARGVVDHPGPFIAGQSNPNKDWYEVQPAELIAAVGPKNGTSATGPRAIQFSIKHAPAAAYQFKVSLLFEKPSVPAMRVTINGKHGMFYFKPKIDPRLGNTSGAFNPAYSCADLLFMFPGTYLHEGSNTITLQAIEVADEAVPTASFTYDAIELSRAPGILPKHASSAEIQPTIFYKQQQRLEEIVDVIIRNIEPIKPSSGVALMVAGKPYQLALTGGEDFGEEKLQFSVAEFSANSSASVAWTVDGHLLHKNNRISPEKKWTLLVVPHIHIDVGFSDYQAKVAAIQSRTIDEAMDMTAKTPDFRFSLDGEWALEQFLKTRTPREQQRVFSSIQKGQLFLPAQYASLLTGFPTAETLIRSLYPSATFSRVHGTPFDYANITDVPSYSWSYASVLAAAGVKYFLAASNNHRAPVLVQGHLNQNSPFWWEGPDGQKVLFWYSRHYHQMQSLFGLPQVLSAGHDTIPLFLQQYERPSYHASSVIVFGTQVENTDLFPQQAELAGQWNSIYAYPHLQYSGFHDGLEKVAQQLGSEIPTISGDGGPYWELGIGSDAYYAAMERETEARGPSAEKLATLTSLLDPRIAVDKTELDKMWTDMVLMDEHTWLSANSVIDPTSEQAVEQLKVKDSRAIEARAVADLLTRHSLTNLGDLIYAGSGSLIVFNPLNWNRSGRVLFDLNNNLEITDTVTGHAVPVEVIETGKELRRVYFTAQDVPAVGYKVFALRHAEKSPLAGTDRAGPGSSPGTVADKTGASSQGATAEAGAETLLESPYYRVRLDPASGAVRSIVDKQLARELVNQQSEYRFGQYLYVDDADRENNNAQTWFRGRLKLQIHPAEGGKLISVERTPDGCVARLESTSVNTPMIKSEIRLFDHEKKIEFTEDVNKKDVQTKEAVYFAFPFAMKKPQFQYEIQTGVVDPAKNMYPGAGLEWFSVQHWVSAQQDGMSGTVMPLDVPLITLGDINRGVWPTQFGDRPGTIFSFAMNNYWEDNYRAGQGGDFRFRYIITSGPSTDSAALSRLGWQEMTPLEKDEITREDKAINLPRPLDGKQQSFLDVQDASVMLQTWKPAEDGNGTILRFLDFGGTTRSVTIHTPSLEMKGAWQTDAVERDQKSLPLSGTRSFQITIHPHEIVTVRTLSQPIGNR